MTRAARLTHLALASVMTAAAVTAVESARAAQTTQADTRRLVERALARLPYYGVFDFLAFGLDRGTVTLMGYAYRQQLPEEVEQSIRRVDGVGDVLNHIEVLPPSRDDDRIRWAAFTAIYQEDFLSRYTPGGPMGATFGLMSFARFPGMQPYGTHAVHIVVKNRRLMLLGVVASGADRILVDVRARQVPGVFEVENLVQASGR